ncbi:MAG: site-specific DNA-methyltransferase [Dysgonamonadaceae bacterium]|jgi:DNA modification methylase|nr:site-specific DNA-methyltransferase [Dysgonamonadaceae bacterium]
METMKKIYTGHAVDVLTTLPDDSIDSCVTSPPYFGLRDYGMSRQIGLEKSPEEYIQSLASVFKQVYRVLKPSGTLWLNIGDSYAGSGRGKGDVNRNRIQSKASFVGDTFDKPYRIAGCKNKDLIGIPWAVAFALREIGWYLRQEIIWHKPNPMPESVRDRCTKSHESIFLMAKNIRYYFDHQAIMEPAKYDGRKNQTHKPSQKYLQNNTGAPVQTISKCGGERWRVINGQFVKNKRDVWTVPTRPFKGAHFATFPPDLIKPCILAGCPPDGTVLDPFFGAGTTGIVAKQLARNFIGIELNPAYVKIATERLA